MSEKSDLWDLAAKLCVQLGMDEETENLSLVHHAMEHAYIIGGNVAWQSLKQSADFHIIELVTKGPSDGTP